MSMSWVHHVRKEANSGYGGPPSRSRKERITATLLGNDDGKIRCPRIIRIGFNLKQGEDPLTYLHDLLEQEGYGSAEELRGRFDIPKHAYVCRPSLKPGHSLNGKPDVVLKQALMLGLCTAQMFDPTRPVIWTRSSLSRVVDLFDIQGFYQ
jgi:hypothetical protein